MRYWEIQEAFREFLQVLKENPWLREAIRRGEVEVVVRTKPRLKIYFRKKPKRKLSWQHAFMLGIYNVVKGMKGKINDLPISAYIAKKAFEKLSPKEKERLRLLFGVKRPKYKYISVSPKLVQRLKEIIRKEKITMRR